MKAIVYENYGPADVLAVKELSTPTPKDGEVLVQVRATSVTTADWRIRAAAFPGIFAIFGRLMFGVFKPKVKVLGRDFAGVVAAVGGGVANFAVGDQVFGVSDMGSHAEYVVAPADGAVVTLPKDLTFEQAAALPFGALSALVFLRDFAKVTKGQKVLIIGASGGVGAYATQIARVLGAQVTGVSSAANIDLVKSLGASQAIDYATEDFTQSQQQFDVILDTVGVTNFRRSRRVLSKNGVFIPLNFGLREVFQSVWTRAFGAQKVLVGVSGDTKADLEELKQMIAQGQVAPIIDRVFPLDEVPAAHRYVEGRHRKGSVVVSVP
ncbi:NAD(P)-dependent alcohol dehydrogenase [Actibacterium lipolyticum]|uniref:Quinone oxidoreductase 1 n=1 Tax=Actibacterium lipolyticum TaxID=1524263 RepID=A0A238JR01_9RHOB|nr:NAD(P)-dependent alcohol dehydrogenase [Actibacterium lipolyticum]SMX32292.1 Quinone oxidoreductase 1 [Actibacterium lipolyticum]